MERKNAMFQPLSPDDIVVWPDDSWCFRSELEEYTWKSDDYRWILISDSEYDSFMKSQEFDETDEAELLKTPQGRMALAEMKRGL
ncbi:gp057 [Erwinia phage vB_Eam-MM7]|uniref:Gp057 n=1 Tax=Erwinia phage vB_Eam-MM7 TaxID=1051674 RepID=G0YPN9_9CAUD|nr:gp057 [Erwinia phage vB_Eam-MM7]AEJ81316.1 gp057 [Erwinia phage vB_Eam-MM7]UNA01031.1 hypothetical protein 1Hena2_00081 [Erwinia phage Hena2]WNA13678.1 hypothetical protein FIfi106_00031 [Erwinia phage FIfi106]